MFARLNRPLPASVLAPIIGGLLSGLVVLLLILASDAPRVPMFVAYHLGLVCGATLTMAVWIIQLRGVARVR